MIVVLIVIAILILIEVVNVESKQLLQCACNKATLSSISMQLHPSSFHTIHRAAIGLN